MVRGNPYINQQMSRLSYERREQRENEAIKLMNKLPSAQDVIGLLGNTKQLPTECSICFVEFNFPVKKEVPENLNKVIPVMPLKLPAEDNRSSIANNSNIQNDLEAQQLKPNNDQLIKVDKEPVEIDQLKDIKLLECSTKDQVYKFYHKKCLI